MNEKMSHPGSNKKKRVRVDEDDEELMDTGIEMANDSDIRADHDLEETSGLISRKRVVRKKSCIHNSCRICMGIMATAVFTFMLIQLWANYGDDIKKRVFSPQIVGAGSYGSSGAQGTAFGFGFHKYVNNTLHLNLSKPSQELVQLDYRTPQVSSYTWDDGCLQIELDTLNHVTVLAWSI